MSPDDELALRGLVLADLAIAELSTATIGRCQARVPRRMRRSERCPWMGVLIADGYRCPKHGYRKGMTPPVVYVGCAPQDPPWTTAQVTLDDLIRVAKGRPRLSARDGVELGPLTVTCAPDMAAILLDDPRFPRDGSIVVQVDATLPPLAWHTRDPRP